MIIVLFLKELKSEEFLMVNITEKFILCIVFLSYMLYLKKQKDFSIRTRAFNLLKGTCLSLFRHVK